MLKRKTKKFVPDACVVEDFLTELSGLEEKTPVFANCADC